MLETDDKKRIKCVIIIFGALIIISANQLDKVITDGWTISFKYQQISPLKVTQADYSWLSLFHAQGPTCMTHLNAPSIPTEFIFSTNWMKWICLADYQPQLNIEYVYRRGRTWFAFSADRLRWLKTNTRGHRRAVAVSSNFFLLHRKRNVNGSTQLEVIMIIVSFTLCIYSQEISEISQYPQS